MNLHLGYFEHPINFPNFPSRSTSFPVSHSGHFSPVSRSSFLFSSNVSPSIVRAPSQSGKRSHERNFPPLLNLITIPLPHLGQRIFGSALPRSVSFPIVFVFSFTYAENGP